MAHVQYTYMIAYVYHSMSFVWVPARTNVPQHYNCWQSVCLLVLVYLLAQTHQCCFLLSVSGVPYAFEELHLFYRDREKKYPFLSCIVFAQSLTCVFYSLSGKSQDSPYTAQGGEKCFLEEKKKSPFDADFFPLKKPYRRRGAERLRKVFLFAPS